MQGLKMTLRCEAPQTKGVTMLNSELREYLSNFKPDGTVTVAIPTMSGNHEVRPISLIGLHPDESVVEIEVDPWDGPGDVPRVGRAMQVQELASKLSEHRDEIGVRIVVPFKDHEHWTRRMLDISEVGFTVGSGRGSGIRLVTENWDTVNNYVVRLREN